ncbi:MAG: AGE family epimerase/isomerase [Pseudomonadota bacterium]
MKYTIYPVILCGGGGTRLWPLSTPKRPKQFLSLTTENTMVENTLSRFQSTSVETITFAKASVVGSKQHERLLQNLLPDCRKILEPFGRDSAPAIAAACLAAEPDALLLILPADHDILDIGAFHRAIESAATAAEKGAIVTFGIEPSAPATGYGYIKAKNGDCENALTVEAFVEKPDLKTAESYLAEGSYYWNAGIFLFRVETMLNALTHFAPDVIDGVRASLISDDACGIIHLEPEAFARTPSISIDYAVMEKAKNVKTVPVNMGWSDVGGYRALHELLSDSETQNYTSGPIVLENSQGLYVRSEGPTIAVNGASDLAIVATKDEVMITAIRDDAGVKALASAVQSNARGLGIDPTLKTRAKDWLWSAFRTWSKVGWDHHNGGFVEQLRLNGTPDKNADRRVRVQARQIYSFAKAIEFGWSNIESAKTLVDDGLIYIDKYLRHREGGFVHLTGQDGSVVDSRRDLYDHAFIILAGSAAYRITGSKLGIELANEAIAYIDEHLKDATHGGWFESSRGELPRRANPHMHLLEAMFEHYAATGADKALERAAEIVRLFETKFFDPARNILSEFFDADWSPQNALEHAIWEPGHHYEWATLLHSFDNLTGHDTLSWRRRLIRQADHAKSTSLSKFVSNTLRADLQVVNDNCRLWHQLEMLRAYLFHPEVAPRSKSSALLSDILNCYLSSAPEGCWIDELNVSQEPVSEFIPASMLYHCVTAFELVMPTCRD